jgi:hypothetical protein
MGVADVRDARASSTDGVAEGATVRALPGLWQCRAGIEVGDRPDVSRHQRDMALTRSSLTPSRRAKTVASTMTPSDRLLEAFRCAMATGLSRNDLPI